jgi:hypothetical protein
VALVDNFKGKGKFVKKDEGGNREGSGRIDDSGNQKYSNVIIMEAIK